jgi:hypothetical protein
MIFRNDQQKKAAYFAVFSTDVGRRVLADITNRLGFWDMKEQANVSAQAQVEMMILAKHILSDAGVWQEIYNTTILLRKEKDGRSWFRRLFGRQR